MTARQLTIGLSEAVSGTIPGANWTRLIFVGAIALAAASSTELGLITRQSLVDAYIQVSVFVAATLFLFYGIERLFHIDAATVMARSRAWQVPVAAAFGALPGCGGAIFVVAAYTRGRLSFGAVLAALTATMGDAAFLLIATRPAIGGLVIAITFVVGVLSGWIADLVLSDPLSNSRTRPCQSPSSIGQLRIRDIAFGAIAVPGLVLGVLALTQIELPGILGITTEVLGLAGAGAALLIWAVSPVRNVTRVEEHSLVRTAEETSFVTVWVIAAFLIYEYAAGLLGLDLAIIAHAAAPAVPLLAILVGFIPGCGPQVLMTTLYLNGVVPFAALLGNAISNDGDALFPALAVNRRAAILATLYSAIPALLVAYGFWLFGPEL